MDPKEPIEEPIEEPKEEPKEELVEPHEEPNEEPEKAIEGFGPADSKEPFVVIKDQKASAWIYTYAIIHFVAFIFALYLSFKCNGGFSIGGFLVAFFCPWIYIIYILAVRGNFCTAGALPHKPKVT